MRRAALALVILSTPVAAAVNDPRPGCRLTPAECAAVLREVAVDADLFAQDGEVLGLGLSPSDRARALIQRDTERMADRLRHLPAPVADEVRRIQACQGLDDAARRGGNDNPDPLCR